MSRRVGRAQQSNRRKLRWRRKVKKVHQCPSTVCFKAWHKPTVRNWTC